jgi:hypothetical protein
LDSYCVPKNVVTFFGIIDESARYNFKDPKWNALASNVVGNALEYVGADGDFIFGLTAIEEHSIFQTRQEYVDFVRSVGLNRNITFAREYDFRNEVRDTLRVFRNRTS